MRLFLGLLIIAYLFTVVGCSERIESFYETFDDAEKSGAVEKGWIPSVLPKSSVTIKEIHDLDSNNVWLCFEIKNIEDNDFLRSIEKVSSEDIKNYLPRDPKVQWWPHNLLIGQENQLNYSFYKTYENNKGLNRVLFFGKKNKEGIIYCWSY